VHEQMDFLVHRNSHLGGYNVVPRFHVMFWIKAE
jgi:hypothetical protein